MSSSILLPFCKTGSWIVCSLSIINSQFYLPHHATPIFFPAQIEFAFAFAHDDWRRATSGSHIHTAICFFFVPKTLRRVVSAAGTSLSSFSGPFDLAIADSWVFLTFRLRYIILLLTNAYSSTLVRLELIPKRAKNDTKQTPE